MLETKILVSQQIDLVKLVKEFNQDYYLADGTALALQLGHRRSIDFDLFTDKDFNNNKVIEAVVKHFPITETFVNQKNQLTVLTNGVKMTWYKYEYQMPVKVDWNGVIRMPDKLVIGCMKAFAIGQRAKWKDYVDIFFLLKQYSLKEICQKTTDLFGEGLFDEVLLRSQLSYFKDIDYSEEVEYLPGFEVEDEVIKKELSKVASIE